MIPSVEGRAELYQTFFRVLRVGRIWMCRIDGEPRTKNKANRRWNPARAEQERIGWIIKETYHDPPQTGEIAMAVIFARGTCRRWDTGNGLKLLEDAATGILWRDDSQIKWHLTCQQLDREDPHTHLAFGVIGSLDAVEAHTSNG